MSLGLSRFFPLALNAALGLAALSFGTGCGALGALANPKAAWAINEPASMSVIVRRAEVAHQTARHVERLVGQTGLDDKSQWTGKTALKSADAETLLKDLGGDPIYAGQKVRVVPAEAWAETFATLCSQERKHPSLVASISPEIAASYGEIAGQEREIAELKSNITELETAIDDKDKASAKADNEKKKVELEAKIEKIEESYKPKVEKFLSTLKDDAAKAKPEVKERLGVAVLNLRRAVNDAKLANSVALIRYPLAIPQMSTEVQAVAKRIVADIVEERTGSRPDTNALNPEVKLDGGSVKLTLGGVSADKLGSLSPEDVVVETTKRMTAWVKRVLTLTAYAAETQQILAFQSNVLEAVADGFGVDATKAELGVDIGNLKVEAMPAAKKGKRIGARSAGGLVASACLKAAPARADKVVAKAEKPATPAAPAGQAKVTPKPTKFSPVAASMTVPAKVVVKTPPAAPAPAIKPEPANGPCEVTVMNGNTRICL